MTLKCLVFTAKTSASSMTSQRHLPAGVRSPRDKHLRLCSGPWGPPSGPSLCEAPPGRSIVGQHNFREARTQPWRWSDQSKRWKSFINTRYWRTWHLLIMRLGRRHTRDSFLYSPQHGVYVRFGTHLLGEDITGRVMFDEIWNDHHENMRRSDRWVFGRQKV